jgi:MYXO-CTERM domain-containing protein
MRHRAPAIAALLAGLWAASAARGDVLMVGADATNPIYGLNRIEFMKGRVEDGAALGGYDFGAVGTFDASQGTPTLATLQHYDALVVWTDYALQDATTLGNNLADYVDAGGNVLVMSFGSAISAPSGRWGTGGYDPLMNPGYAGDQIASLGAITPEGAPFFAGVSSITAEYIQSGTVRPGATLLASWDSTFGQADYAPLAILANGFAGHVINLNFYGGYPYTNTHGDIDRLMANALNSMVAPVPEPSSAALGLAGLGLGLAWRARRRGRAPG